MSIGVYLSKMRSRGCGSLLGTHSWKIKTSMQEQDHINLACKLPQNTIGVDVSLYLKSNRCPYLSCKDGAEAAFAKGDIENEGEWK